MLKQIRLTPFTSIIQPIDVNLHLLFNQKT